MTNTRSFEPSQTQLQLHQKATLKTAHSGPQILSHFEQSVSFPILRLVNPSTEQVLITVGRKDQCSTNQCVVLWVYEEKFGRRRAKNTYRSKGPKNWASQE